MPVEVWAAIIALLAGIIGVSIGAFLQGAVERRHWERQIRLDAYDQFLTALDEFVHQLGRKPIDLDQTEIAKREARTRLSRVLLVGSTEAVNPARAAMMHLLIQDHVARVIALNGITPEGDLDSFGDVHSQRWRFITASRKDAKVKPSVVPKESFAPLTDIGEEVDNDDVSDDSD